MILKASTKELFEGYDLSNFSPEQIINSKKLYNYIVESAEVAKEEGVELDQVLDEGIFAGLVGAIAGSTVGPAIGKAICKVMGISETGTLGLLLTSRLVLGAICTELGLQY